MLSFHPLTLADKAWVDDHVFSHASRSADFNFGNMFLWDRHYCQHLCDYGGRLVVLTCCFGTPFYPFPVGKGDLAPVIEAMKEFAHVRHFPFTIHGVERENCAQLEALYPGKFRFEEQRDYADYLYSAEKLASLSGKKLHGKRNFCNRFENSYRWHFEVLAPRHFDACRSLLAAWSQGNDSDTVRRESAAIERAFEHYDSLDLLGGALFVEDRLMAFTIGERIAQDTVDIHFEKADESFVGAYAMINREYARLVRQHWSEVLYLNREDDMGLENLRQAKLSYRPEFLVEKFTATWVDAHD